MNVYLDHAASSTPRPQARAVLLTHLDAANGSAAHQRGQNTRAVIEEARERVAAAIGATPHEVVFTSGGTEADNLALKGIIWAARDARRTTPHLIISATEHAAVKDAAVWLAERGDATLDLVGCGPDGCIDVDQVLGLLRAETALVSVMTANNELGSINPIAELAAALAPKGVPLHTDAVQAIATLDVNVTRDQISALAASGHKFGAPQGVGFAVLRRNLPVVPLHHGGGQDRGVRSGTFATALIASVAAALDATVAERQQLVIRLNRLSDKLAANLTTLEGVRRNGPVDPTRRLASHVHLSIDDVAGELLGLRLDALGIATSGGAACSSGATTASHVLVAAGITGTPLRLSLGWDTTDNDIDTAITGLSELIPALQAHPGVWA
ncbi:MAG: cysteine desulfurase family protein [Nitriliruptoraceae bacterium]